MKQLRFTIVSKLSVAVFVASVGVWIGTVRHTFHFAYQPRPRWLYEIACGNGQICFLKEDGPADLLPRKDSPAADVVEGGNGSRLYQFGAIEYQDLDFNPPPGEAAYTGGRYITVSWLPICISTGAASALLTALRARSRTRIRSALQRTECLRCGYDLRATPVRCPECGAVPTAIKA